MSGESNDRPRQQQQGQQAQQGQQQAQRTQQGQQRRGQPPGGQPQQGVAGGDDTEVRAAKFGVLVFLVPTFGVFILNTVQLLIGDDEAVLFHGFEEEELFGAVLDTMGANPLIDEAGLISEFPGFFPVAAPLFAVVTAVYFYSSADFTDSTPKLAAIATAAGVAATCILMLLLAVIFEPDIIEVDIGDEIVGFIGFLIGNVIVAGLVGYIIDEDPLDVRI